jgi:hypothetical protein
MFSDLGGDRVVSDEKERRESAADGVKGQACTALMIEARIVSQQIEEK